MKKGRALLARKGARNCRVVNLVLGPGTRAWAGHHPAETGTCDFVYGFCWLCSHFRGLADMYAHVCVQRRCLVQCLRRLAIKFPERICSLDPPGGSVHTSAPGPPSDPLLRGVPGELREVRVPIHPGLDLRGSYVYEHLLSGHCFW